MASAALGECPLYKRWGKLATRKRAHKSKPFQGIVVKKAKLGVAIESAFDRYKRMEAIGGGAYGTVYRAMDTRTGEIVAMKKEKHGLSKTTLREIDILQSLRGHSSVVEIKEVVKNEKDRIFVVMEYMDNNLHQCIEAAETTFDIAFVKRIMKQLLEGVAFIHDKGVIHRDLKPNNILMSEGGDLKICDFGLSRRSDRELGAAYSPEVGSLCYKAPELLLGTESYSCVVDMWSKGCIMVEVLTQRTLFEGSSEIDQLYEIFRVLGTPDDVNLPGMDVKFFGPRCNVLWQELGGRAVVNVVGLDLMNKLLAYEPAKRITAADALHHAWFKED